jgi:hypothetical protein
MGVMADSVEAVAFEEAGRAITQQQQVLDGLRTRAGTLLSMASVSTSFLGGLTLDKKRLAALTLLALVAFAAVGALTVYILYPRGGWVFGLSAKTLIKNFIDTQPKWQLSAMYRDLALHLENHYDRNARQLVRLFWLFRLASGLLVVEVILWLLVLGGVF